MDIIVSRSNCRFPAASELKMLMSPLESLRFVPGEECSCRWDLHTISQDDPWPFFPFLSIVPSFIREYQRSVMRHKKDCSAREDIFEASNLVWCFYVFNHHTASCSDLPPNYSMDLWFNLRMLRWLTCLTTRAWVNGQATRFQLLRRFGVGPTLSYILSLIGVCVWMRVVCEGLCKIDKDGLPRKAGGKLICSSHMKHSETIWNYFNYFWILPGSWHKLRGSRGLWWRGRGADWHDFPWFWCDMLS